MKHGLWISAALVGLLGMAGYWLGGSVLLLNTPVDSRPVVSLEADEGCTLDEVGCRYRIQAGVLWIRAGDSIGTLEPFQVRLEGPDAVEAAEIVFTMDGMDMGLNQFRFRKETAGNWVATAMLPVCAVDRADWLATVTVEISGRRLQARIPFVTR